VSWRSATESRSNLTARYSITDKAIGDVCHRFQDTDIGLAHLHDTVAFENNPYLQVSTPLTKLLHSEKLRSDLLFGVDTFVTGYQPLRSAGVRVVRRSQSVVRGRENPPYLAIAQGIL
jgi:hypothetical protein